MDFWQHMVEEALVDDAVCCPTCQSDGTPDVFGVAPLEDFEPEFLWDGSWFLEDSQRGLEVEQRFESSTTI
jgi:hypothetical protein